MTRRQKLRDLKLLLEADDFADFRGAPDLSWMTEGG